MRNILFTFLVLSIILSGNSRCAEINKECLIITNTKTTDELWDIVYFIEENEGNIRHIFPPNVIQGDISNRLRNILRNENIAETITETLFEPALERQFKKNARFGITAWNKNCEPTTKGVFRLGGSIYNDCFYPPDAVKERGLKQMSPDIPTSEYMIGSCAVGIIFLESSGQHERQTENWTESEKNLVVNNIWKGLEWWAKDGNEKAHLRWLYEIQNIETGYEPIRHEVEDEKLWITEAMEKLGYKTDNYIIRCRKFADSLRRKYNTDWAFLIFVVDSSNDKDGKFYSGQHAYAYLGGPFMVINYKNDGWGPDVLYGTVSHEVGHIFGALDEYGKSVMNKRNSGVLDVPNGNHEAYGVISEGCIMKSHCDKICYYTRGQIGWWDKDNDEKFDVDKTQKHPHSKLSLKIDMDRYTNEGLLKPLEVPLTTAKPPPEPKPITIETVKPLEVVLKPPAEIIETKPTESEIIPPEKILGKVTVQTFPENAKIYIDDIYKGNSPLVLDNLSHKNYKLQILKAGYKPYNEYLNINKNKTRIEKVIRLVIDDPVEALAVNLINNNSDIKIDIKLDKPTYYIGEKLITSFQTNRDCYFYLINISTDNKIYIIFPNKYSSDNLIQANKRYYFPDKNSNFDFEIDEPYGKDKLIFIASKTPIEIINNNNFRSIGIFQVLPNEYNEQFIRELATSLQSLPPKEWASKLLYFKIVE